MFKTSTGLLALLATLVSATPASAAIFDVNQAAWGTTTTANSFAWAIHQANITPGADTIRLFKDVSVDTATPYEAVSGFLTQITDTSGLRIEGNGHALTGIPGFLTSNGDYIGKNIPSRAFKPSSGDVLVGISYSFARIADNVSNVTIDRMVFDGLNAVLDIGENSVASIVNSTIK
jgi:hypothetical protein